MSDVAPEEESRPTRRGFLVGGVAVGGALAVGGGGAPGLWLQPSAAAGGALRVAGAHLTVGSDAQRAMTVSWSTADLVASPVLDYGPTRDYGSSLTSEDRPSKDVASVYHHVPISGLEPGTTYFYRLRHDGGTPYTGSFTTAPVLPTRFRFALLGDMGVNTFAVATVALIRRQHTQLAFVAGDLCYADFQGRGTGGPENQNFKLWDRFLAQISSSASKVPWMTTVGNHEMEGENGDLGYNGYLDRFELPGNGAVDGAVTYSFVRGNVGFVALDGNDASYEITHNQGYLGGAQDAWLVDTLSTMRQRPGLDFIVVGFHNCAYCTSPGHGSDGGVRDRWGAIFDQFEVDVVVNGHNHCYERTHPIRAGLPAATAPSGSTVDSSLGTTYLTAGGAGAPLATSDPSQPYVVDESGTRIPEAGDWSAVRTAQHCIVFVDALPRSTGGVAQLRLRVLTSDETVLDQLVLRRRHRPTA